MMSPTCFKGLNLTGHLALLAEGLRWPTRWPPTFQSASPSPGEVKTRWILLRETHGNTHVLSLKYFEIMCLNVFEVKAKIQTAFKGNKGKAEGLL